MKNQKQTIRKIVAFLNNEDEEGGFWLPNIQRPFVCVTARVPHGRSSRARVGEGRLGSRAGGRWVTRTAAAARGLDPEARRRCSSG